jgi:hypothetical protein
VKAAGGENADGQVADPATGRPDRVYARRRAVVRDVQGHVQEVRIMRAVDCPCGEHFEEDTDAKVLDAIKEHADEDHPGRYEDAELRLLVNTTAYDAAA